MTAYTGVAYIVVDNSELSAVTPAACVRAEDGSVVTLVGGTYDITDKSLSTAQQWAIQTVGTGQVDPPPTSLCALQGCAKRWAGSHQLAWRTMWCPIGARGGGRHPKCGAQLLQVASAIGMKDADPLPLWKVEREEYDTDASPDWYARGP